MGGLLEQSHFEKVSRGACSLRSRAGAARTQFFENVIRSGRACARRGVDGCDDLRKIDIDQFLVFGQGSRKGKFRWTGPGCVRWFRSMRGR